MPKFYNYLCVTEVPHNSTLDDVGDTLLILSTLLKGNLAVVCLENLYAPLKKQYSTLTLIPYSLSDVEGERVEQNSFIGLSKGIITKLPKGPLRYLRVPFLKIRDYEIADNEICSGWPIKDFGPSFLMWTNNQVLSSFWDEGILPEFKVLRDSSALDISPYLYNPYKFIPYLKWASSSISGTWEAVYISGFNLGEEAPFLKGVCKTIGVPISIPCVRENYGIVVVGHNQADHLVPMVEALTNQLPLCPITLVLDRCTDCSEEVAKSISVHKVIVRNDGYPHYRVCSNRNLGANVYKDKHILFLDGDRVPTSLSWETLFEASFYFGVTSALLYDSEEIRPIPTEFGGVSINERSSPWCLSSIDLNTFSAGMLLSRATVGKLQNQQEGQIFLEAFDGDYGRDDEWVGLVATLCGALCGTINRPCVLHGDPLTYSASDRYTVSANRTKTYLMTKTLLDKGLVYDTLVDPRTLLVPPHRIKAQPKIGGLQRMLRGNRD